MAKFFLVTITITMLLILASCQPLQYIDVTPEITNETYTTATEAPATDVPDTEAPATEAPATQVPATEAPATQVPATGQSNPLWPTPNSPTNNTQSTEPPVSEPPVSEPPASELPVLSNISVKVNAKCACESESRVSCKITLNASGGKPPYTYDPNRSFQFPYPADEEGTMHVEVTSKDNQRWTADLKFQKFQCP